MSKTWREEDLAEHRGMCLRKRHAKCLERSLYTSRQHEVILVRTNELSGLIAARGHNKALLVRYIFLRVCAWVGGALIKARPTSAPRCTETLHISLSIINIACQR